MVVGVQENSFSKGVSPPLCVSDILGFKVLHGTSKIGASSVGPNIPQHGKTWLILTVDQCLELLVHVFSLVRRTGLFVQLSGLVMPYMAITKQSLLWSTHYGLPYLVASFCCI